MAVLTSVSVARRTTRNLLPIFISAMLYHRCRVNRNPVTLGCIWRNGIMQMRPRADTCAAHPTNTTARRNTFALLYQCLAEMTIRADIIIIVRDFNIDSAGVSVGVGHKSRYNTISGGKYISPRGRRNINAIMHTPRFTHRMHSPPKW